MSQYFELQKRALGIIDRAAALSEESGFDTIREVMYGARTSMLSKELLVIVAGEAKQGKSSLINMLLEEADPLCPVDLDICTNVVTVIRYGQEEEILVSCLEGDEMRTKPITRSELPKYASESGNPGNVLNVLQIEARIPNEKLKEGIVFIDTPGIGSLNPEHAEVTFRYLPMADLLLFVTDARKPLSLSEIEFLKRGYSFCKNVIFPLTKKDTASELDTIIGDNRRKISQALALPEDQIPIVAVSSTAKQRYLRNPQRFARYLEQSNFPALEETISSAIVVHHAKIGIAPYMAVVSDELKKLVDMIKVQLEAVDRGNSADTYQGKLKELEQQLQYLLDEDAKWREEIQHFFRIQQIQINSKHSSFRKTLQSELTKRKNELKLSLCEPEQYSMVYNDLLQKLLDNSLQIKNDLYNQLEELLINLQNGIDGVLSLPSGEPEEPQSIIPADNALMSPIHTDSDIQIDLPKKKFWDSVKTQGREMGSSNYALVSFFSTAGMVIGGAAGGVLGAAAATSVPIEPVATVLGSVAAGSALGDEIGNLVGKGVAMACNVFSLLGKAFSGKRHYDESDVRLIYDHLNNLLAEKHTEESANLSMFQVELQRKTTAAMKQKIAMLKKQLQALRESLMNSAKLEAEQRQEHRKKLLARIKTAQKLSSELNALVDEIARLSICAPAQSVPVKTASRSTQKKKVEYDFL